MAIMRAQVSWGADYPDVRHRFVITPHFNIQTAGGLLDTEAQGFADDLCTAMHTWAGGSRETSVKVYDAESNPPNYPKGRKTLALGITPPSNSPRELALCLSYRAGDGPRRRGRLYLPVPLLTGSGAGVRPGTAVMTKAGELAPLLRAAGGANVQWGVWSRRDNAFYPAQSAYVDNEWDIIRSRGGEADMRQSAGTGS
jgi:hypothetical protein